MWNRKNFLKIALLLNCLYFIGTSLLVVRYVNLKDQSPLKAWLEESSRAITNKLIWDAKKRLSMIEALKNLNTKAEFESWAQKNDIVAIIGQNNDEDINHVGQRESIPFKRSQLLQENAVGFFYRNNQLHLNYFVRQTKDFLLTQSFKDDFIRLLLEPAMMEVTVIEFHHKDSPQLLYTTLTKAAAEDLLEHTSVETLDQEPQHIVLDKEVHFIKSEPLLNLSDFKQKIFFSKKHTQYNVVTLFDVLMLIWTSFCIVVVLNVLLFKKYEPSGLPQ